MGVKLLRDLLSADMIQYFKELGRRLSSRCEDAKIRRGY